MYEPAGYLANRVEHIECRHPARRNAIQAVGGTPDLAGDRGSRVAVAVVIGSYADRLDKGTRLQHGVDSDRERFLAHPAASKLADRLGRGDRLSYKCDSTVEDVQGLLMPF